ncbi:2TM domain-containing protein [Flavobacterium artemisiae]|uniref:2TM domain-containing protein n=1 Tax=Flavobacterium artemisiae TaxID=2126556 RepID=A0ABW4HBN4_9FLAO
METNYFNEQENVELQKIAKKKVLKLKSFYSDAFIYLIVVIVYILKENTEAPLNFFPLNYINEFVMCIATMIFLVSAVDFFASNKVFGDEWEERKVRSLIEKKTEKQKWE